MELDRYVFIPAVTSTFLFWFSLYALFCLTLPDKRWEWNCRLVTLIHASIICFMSWLYGFYYNPWVFTDPGGEINVYEMLVLVICVGYFIFDIGWCIWFYDPNEKFMLLHHILTIFGMFLVLHSGRAGTELSATIFGTELSNPFLQIRWFMRESGYDNTWLYEINDFVFMMVFFICRSCIGTYFLYTEWSHPRPWLRFKLGGTAIYLISVVFTINIASFAFKKYTRMFRRWKSRRKIANGDIRNGHVCMKHKSE